MTGGLGEGEDDRDQDDEGDVEEDRDRDQTGGEQQGLLEAPLTERVRGGVGDRLGATGAFDDAAEHGAEPDQQGDAAQIGRASCRERRSIMMLSESVQQQDVDTRNYILQ